MRKFTGEELIAYVRERAKVPNSATTGTEDEDILNRINEELMTTIVPVVRRAREEYFAVTRRIPIVSGTDRYRIPARAIGQQIRNIFYHDGSNRVSMRRVPLEDTDEFGSTDTDQFPAFRIEGNHIVLVGFSGAGSLEVTYLIRPGQVVLSTDTRIIQSVDSESRIITLTSAVPESWETTTQGFDVHSPYSGAELKQFDLTRVEASGVTVEVAEEIDGSVFGSYQPAAGDYVCLAGEAALPALPIEWHIPLAQAAVCRVVESIGDMEALGAHRQTLTEMLKMDLGITSNRVDSHPIKIKARNGPWGGRVGSWGGGSWS